MWLQLVLDLGYEVLWSDMDSVWLKDFFSLAPQGLDYVGVDDSEVENEQVRFCVQSTHLLLQHCLLSAGKF